MKNKPSKPKIATHIGQEHYVLEISREGIIDVSIVYDHFPLTWALNRVYAESRPKKRLVILKVPSDKRKAPFIISDPPLDYVAKCDECGKPLRVRDPYFDSDAGGLSWANGEPLCESCVAKIKPVR
jgi:hypothetical protein